ncbi:hypothetical protein RDV89_15020 [Nocardioides zeae]|uniref:Rax2-like C-terminal domain-containing protein n=1 Tax=Nocardioides imazamoxiresistens TaxID=3231893 RepID=A0ABU3PZ54_9ACTN|nr:hypothetical protein [Nocardioides zeae]MDT9594394.1 hypothetical protein [Nocardioides zeae]
MTRTQGRRWRGAGAVAAVLAALLVGQMTGAPAAHAATTFSDAPLPMAQTNGPVWTVEMAGGRIYAGGSFTSTRPSGSPAGTGETNQAQLAAFDPATGARIAGFAPRLTNDWDGSPGTVHAMAVSPDGRTLVVGGDFNLVDGKRAEHLARFDAATGAFLGQVGWNGVNGTVRSLAFSPDGRRLYVGGAFSVASWQARDRLAAFDLTTNAVTPWAPVASLPVQNEALRITALAVSSDGSRVFVGGPFRRMNGASYQGVAAVDATDGRNVGSFRSDYLLAPYNWATTLQVVGTTLYLAGRDDYSGSADRREGVSAISTTTGTRQWYSQCYGDTFDVLAVGQELYVASHAHDCSRAGGFGETNPRRYVAMHVLDRSTGRVKSGFQVLTNGTSNDPDSLLLSRSLATDGHYLVMGGGFTWAQGRQQANLVRFGAG